MHGTVGTSARFGRMSASMRTRAILLLGLALGACSTYSNDPACKVGADCASGVCNANGTCEPVSTSTTSTTTETGGGGTGGTGTTSTTSVGGGGTGGALCSPNADGKIERTEVGLMAGLHATFLVGNGATFDTKGTENPDKTRVWDLDIPLPSDHKLLLETHPLDDQLWFAKDYATSLPAPDSHYAARLSDTADLLGVFEITGTKLLLHGVASSADSATATEMHFTPPVVVLDFPLTAGKTWDTLAAVSGKLSGIPIGGIYNEEYTSTVDAVGKLKTPYADFDVLRVHTRLLRFLNGASMVRHTHSFIAECFGNVATIVSQDYETSDEFTQTSEIWRFSP